MKKIVLVLLLLIIVLGIMAYVPYSQCYWNGSSWVCQQPAYPTRQPYQNPCGAPGFELCVM